MDTKRALKIALFAAFLVCLYVSIPHLAWVFHAWESGAADTPFIIAPFGLILVQTSQEWVNAYLQAMSIDVIIALLSITLTNSKRHDQTTIGYIFVGLLIGISWLFNWLYAKEHAPTTGGIWQHTEMWGFIHLNTVTPIITSALPVFALAFTIMIDKLTGERVSIEQLEAEAEERERLKKVKDRIKATQRETTTETITTAFSFIGQAKDQAMKTLGQRETALDKTLTFLRDARELLQSENEERALQALSAHLKIRSKTVLPLLIQARSIIQREDQEAMISVSSSDQDQDQEPMMNAETLDQEAIMNAETLAEDQVLNDDENGPSTDHEMHIASILNDMSGRETVPLEVAAEVLNCQTRHVVSLRNQGKLKHGRRREDLITVASLRAYLASRKRRTSQLTATPQLRAVKQWEIGAHSQISYKT